MSANPARKGWDGDLADGVLRERAFGRILLAGREKWEHKRDYQCSTTGNIAIEYETSEQPHGEGRKWGSGISVTEAHWWILEFKPDHRLIVPLPDLKALARRAIRAGLHQWIGDDHRFHNALIPFEWFREEDADP